MRYTEKLNTAIRQHKSTLCVGLDPVYSRLPQSIRDKGDNTADAVVHFCKEVIDITSDHCAAYKPNLAFFEALGTSAFKVLKEVCDYIPSDKIVIADAKRGDISSTAQRYRKTFFDWLNADAITLNPLMGFDTLEPFNGYPGKALYILTLTSNPGADDFFLQPLSSHSNVSEYIAESLNNLADDHETHLGMVVGATKSSMIQQIVSHYPGGALLIPGLGKQGGRVSDLLDILKNQSALPLINASRSIIYADAVEGSWQEGVRRAAESYQKELKPLTEQYV